MANYIVSDTNLTAVADAIRQKGGTSASLEFPDDFVSAIGDIETGGGSSVTVEALNVTQNGTYTAPAGTAYSPVTVSVSGSGGGTDTLKDLEAKTITTWTNADASDVREYLFKGITALTSVNYANATKVKQNAFSGCSRLATVNIPKLAIIELYGFQSCTSLTSISFEQLTEVGQYAFTNCTNIESVNLPKVTAMSPYSFSYCSKLTSFSINPDFNNSGSSYLFQGCSSLTTLDLKKMASIAANMFNGCTNLNTIVLRKTGSTATLYNINAFTGTPFASGGSGGTLYVPNDLIASYQSANNWSTILGYANNQIKAIEGSIYE